MSNLKNISRPGQVPEIGDILERDLGKGRKYRYAHFVPQPITAPTRAIQVGKIIDLCQSAGGVTDTQLVAAYNNAANKALWIKLSFTGALAKDDALAVELINALTSPANVQAVIDAW